MAQIPVRRSDTEAQVIGSTASPIPAGFNASDELFVSGWTWVDFRSDINNSAGITQVEHQVQYAFSQGGPWQTVKVEDVDRSLGTGNVNDLTLTDPQAPANEDSVITVPVFGVYMRLLTQVTGGPGGTSVINFSAIRRN